MRRIERLRLEALESCRWRGHTMGRFLSLDNAGTVRIAHCTVCDADVFIRSRPAPNEIDMGGEAIALDCPAEKAQI